MTTTVSFSELINHPKSTVSKIDRDRALRLRRRDAEDLVLKAATRDDQELSRILTEDTDDSRCRTTRGGPGSR